MSCSPQDSWNGTGPVLFMALQENQSWILSEADASLEITCRSKWFFYVFSLCKLCHLTSRAPQGCSRLILSFYFIFFSLNILGAGRKHSWVLWGGSWNQSTSFSVVTVILDISCNLSVLWVPTTRLEIKKCKTSLLHMLELLWSSCRTFPLAVGNVQIEFANGDFHLSSAQGCCSLVDKNKLRSISWANVWSALLDISTTSRWYTLCWPEACRTFLTS